MSTPSKRLTEQKINALAAENRAKCNKLTKAQRATLSKEAGRLMNKPEIEVPAVVGLCCRCEHRVRFIEATMRKEPHIPRPRCECGDVDRSSFCCYMYVPVKPVMTAVQRGDKRPVFGICMIAARQEGRKVADSTLRVVKVKGGHVAYWQPKGKVL
jgi:hypothetical protein